MSNYSRRYYWKLVRDHAWTQSKEHFAWRLPVLLALVTAVLAWLFLGRQTALDDYIVPGAVGLLAALLTAILMYVYNFMCAPADIHSEQLTAMRRLEQESEAAIAALEHQSEARIAELEQEIRALKDVPDPLRILFVAGQPPYEETHTVTVDVPLSGLRAGMTFKEDRIISIFRVRVENTSALDVENVHVRLKFEPARTGMSNLPLRLMHDHPREGESHKRSFTLPAYDHQDVDVVQYTTPNDFANICHTLALDSALPYGEYNVVVTVHGSGVRPKQASFAINVMPQAVWFRECAGSR